MYINFNLDRDFYSGTATHIENGKESQYLIDVNKFQFTIWLSAGGKWESHDRVDHDLIFAAGSEILRHDDNAPADPLLPNTYYSTARIGGLTPIFKDGEVTNEPDDVDEQNRS